MEVSGEISKKNEELGYGFVTVKGSDDVFFSPDSVYSDVSFPDLKIGQKVRIKVVETERGLFAASLSLATNKKSVQPDLSI